jgi:hypothetical protein
VKFLWNGQAAARPGYLFAIQYQEHRTGPFCLATARNFPARLVPSVDERSFMMDKQLQTLLDQQWSNNAFRGYLIWAMENCGFSPDDIQCVVSELHYVFDMKSIEEADRHYCDSPY